MIGLRCTARWALLAIVAQLLLPRGAHADDAWRDRLARIHFDAGRKAYEAGQYEDAVLEFERGYQLAPRPLFLLNLAHLYLRLGRYDDVIAACERYLASHPNDRLTREATDLLAAARQKKLEQAPKPTPTPAEPKAPVVAPAANDVGARADQPAPAAPRPGPARPKLAWTGVATTVVGVAALVTAAVLIGHATALNDDFNHPRTGTVYDHDTIVQWEREQQAAIGLFAAGGAVVVAGTLMTIIGWRGPRDGPVPQAVQLKPLVGGDVIGASVRLSF
jgi:hypothetical protein